jgi:hypothetical protein
MRRWPRREERRGEEGRGEEKWCDPAEPRPDTLKMQKVGTSPTFLNLSSGSRLEARSLKMPQAA